MNKRMIFGMLAVLLSCSLACAEDVTGFRGKNQQGIFAGKGLLKAWSKEGLKPLWVYSDLGAGWGSPVIADKRIFITGGDPTDPTMEMLTCLNSKGEKIWSVRTAEAWTRSYPGARITPAYVAGENRREGHLFVLTGGGVLLCIAEKDGRVVWKQNVAQDYQGKPGTWGYAECPTVADGKVFASPGGSKASMVAFDQKTGKVVWEASPLQDQAAYVAPVLLKGQLIQVGARYVFGVDLRSGKLKWKFNYLEYGGKRGEINCNPVLVKGSQILVSSGYDHGSVMLELQPSGDDVKVLWDNAELDPHHGGLVEYNGKIYSSNWTNNSTGNWICVDWNSGKTLYDTPWDNLGKGQIIGADGMLYLYEEKRGTVALANPNPARLDIISQFPFTLGSKEHWAHPVICDGKLYLRRGNALAVYDIQGK